MRRSVALLACLPLVLAASGCTGDTEEGGDAAPSETPSAEPTPLSQLSTGTVAVARADFCEAFSQTGVEKALGGAVEKTDHYGPGDRVRLGSGPKDVAHEFACSFTSADGTVARAWVFSPPVTRRQAQSLVDAARDGCAAPKDVAKFGTPSVATVCGTGSPGGGAEAAYQGLFGDAWLSCSLSPNADTSAEGAPEALLDRTGAWCVQVIDAARAG